VLTQWGATLVIKIRERENPLVIKIREREIKIRERGERVDAAAGCKEPLRGGL